jgi:hypothetical protein
VKIKRGVLGLSHDSVINIKSGKQESDLISERMFNHLFEILRALNKTAVIEMLFVAGAIGLTDQH